MSFRRMTCNKIKSRIFRRSRKTARYSQGVYLVEVLVAILVGTLFAFALLDAAAISMRLATTTQNEVYANTILMQLMEATRASSYDELSPLQGEHTLLANRTSSGEIGSNPNLRAEPVQLNFIDKIWEDATENGRFRDELAEIKYIVEPGPVVNTTLRITATVSWNDSFRYDSSKKRSVKATTIVSKYGS